MSQIINKYKVHTRHQLIDLNKDHTNFKLKFVCNCDQDYFMYITNQEELDSVDISSLPFKKVKGQISGNIVSDNNQYQNYFLILYAESPCEIEVIIELEPIEIISSTSETPPLQPSPLQQQQHKEETYKSPPQPPSTTTTTTTTNRIYRIIFWIGLIVLFVFIIYYFFIRKSYKRDMTESSSIVDDINKNL